MTWGLAGIPHVLVRQVMLDPGQLVSTVLDLQQLEIQSVVLEAQKVAIQRQQPPSSCDGQGRQVGVHLPFRGSLIQAGQLHPAGHQVGRILHNSHLGQGGQGLQGVAGVAVRG